MVQVVFGTMLNLSIIILSYNTKEYLRDCLQSIYNNLPKGFFEVIVVDNASIDNSIEMVLKEFPKVNVFKSDKNLGFAKGVNMGAKKAKGELLLFLNSDAVLQNDKVVEMTSFIRRNEDVGILGGLLVNQDLTRQRSYGKFYTLPVAVKMLIGGDRMEIRGKRLDKPVRVDWVSGGFMMVKTSIFTKISGFDENYFMYMEDVDLCYRAKNMGFLTFIFPDSYALHLSHGSSNRTFAIENIYKGLLYFYKKHRHEWEYNVLKFILFTKAWILMSTGILIRNQYLKNTYRNVIRV